MYVCEHTGIQENQVTLNEAREQKTLLIFILELEKITKGY